MTLPPRFGEVIEPRRYVGWILFLVLVFLTSGLASVMYNSAASKTFQQAQVVDQALREAVLGPKKLQRANWRIFERKLAKIQKTDPRRYALLNAVSSYERTKTVDPKDIEVLRRSSKAGQRLFADVYTKHLPAKELEALGRDIPKELFAGVLASIHAHERNGDTQYRASHLPNLEKTEGPSAVQTNVLGSLGIAGFLLLSGYIALRAAGYLKPLGPPLFDIGLFDADRLAMRSAQIMLLIIGVGLVPSLISGISPEQGQLVETCVLILLLFALLLTPIWGRKFTATMVGINAKNLFKNIGWGVGGYLANIPVLFFVAVVSSNLFKSMPVVRHPIETEIFNAAGPVMWLSIFASASIQAPIVEETLFRGTLLPAMTRVFKSPLIGIVLSSLIFASGHATGLPSWLPLAEIGAMAALLTYQTRSLVPAMVFHGLHNAVQLLMTIYWG